MSKLQTFTLESDDGDVRPVVYLPERDVVQIVSPADSTRFVELGDVRENHYVYSWRDIHSAGKLKLPAHMVYNLPELLTILNIVKDYSIFTPLRVYKQEPLETLFTRKES